MNHSVFLLVRYCDGDGKLLKCYIGIDGNQAYYGSPRRQMQAMQANEMFIELTSFSSTFIKHSTFTWRNHKSLKIL